MGCCPTKAQKAGNNGYIKKTKLLKCQNQTINQLIVFMTIFWVYQAITIVLEETSALLEWSLSHLQYGITFRLMKKLSGKVERHTSRAASLDILPRYQTSNQLIRFQQHAAYAQDFESSHTQKLRHSCGRPHDS